MISTIIKIKSKDITIFKNGYTSNIFNITYIGNSKVDGYGMFKLVGEFNPFFIKQNHKIFRELKINSIFYENPNNSYLGIIIEKLQELKNENRIELMTDIKNYIL